MDVRVYLKGVIPLDHVAILVGLILTRFLLHMFDVWNFKEVKVFYAVKAES